MLLTAHLPVFDFLAPSILQLPRVTRINRHHSTTSTLSSAAAGKSNNVQDEKPFRYKRTPNSTPEAISDAAPTYKPLTQAQRDFLNRAVRPHSHIIFISQFADRYT